MANIIAELCQNHDGSVERMKAMVRAAAQAGADYAKIQSMLATDLTKRERFEEGVTDGNGIVQVIKRPYRAEYDRLKPLDLDDKAHHVFIEECKKQGIQPLTTCFNRTRIPFLAELPWAENAVKISSFDCRSKPMLRELAEAGFKKLYVSTGTTYDDEIRESQELMDDLGLESTLLHCVSIYPTPLAEAHLNRMDFLRRINPHVGFSDHSMYAKNGLKMSIAALYQGAEVIERHFTVLSEDQTRDGPVSLNPDQMAELCEYARMSKDQLREVIDSKVPEFETMLGSETRELSPTELLNRDYYHGRFGNKVGDQIVYNWEDTPLR